MAENSKIEWTDHTFNPWRGCSKVSAGCKNCYADTLSNRNPGTLGVWGKSGTRVVASEAMWKQPVKWNAEAEITGIRKRVFCASLADVFEGRDTMPEESWPGVEQARLELFGLIKETPHLDWLLLTKRPENVIWALRQAASAIDTHRRFREHREAWTELASFGAEMLIQDWVRGIPPENVWLGTSVENQEMAEARIPHLLNVPAKVRFLSCEPLLGPVDLTMALEEFEPLNPDLSRKPAPISWVIAGGESGHGARPFAVEWARELKSQCEEAEVPFLLKQLGSNPHASLENADEWPNQGMGDLFGPVKLKDKKGGDMSEWPKSLRVRQFPEVTP